MRHLIPLLTTLFLACLCDVAKAQNPEQAKSPNIVLILVDDMGYGDPGCFNPKSKIATPNIDSLARDGMRFTDAHAPGPLCHMSRYGLMTGKYPFRTDVTRWPTEPLIAAEQTTIATLAKSVGYETAMVGKWHLGFQEDGYDRPLPGGPVDCGFDQFFGIRASTDIPPYFYIRNDQAVSQPTQTITASQSNGWSPIQGQFWRAGGIADDLTLKSVLPRFTDEAVDVIERHRRDAQSVPLFLYLAYPAPHTPWLPSPEFVGKSEAGMYGDFMMMVDAEIGRVLAKLDEAKMTDDTLVIFTSDNGPVWFDADVDRLGHDSAGGLRGMKSDAWEAGHRMPMIVRYPGQVVSGTTSNQLVCFTDFLATFADLWDAGLAKEDGPDSFSFIKAMTPQASSDYPSRKSLVMQAGSDDQVKFIRRGKWKLITGLGSGGFSKPTRVSAKSDGVTGQLYDLEIDLGETNNQFATEPEIVGDLLHELKDVINDGRHRTAQP
ncbi:Arylsulfatase [Rubripirellula obstinata]|uniref:Arylsulfatase n=1 Tax=Rubripirellula obstinata TaxID=406547 RepID=A0A5B1CI70_9BACT|nr:arylsulfatase [Rubripirellula obstinata]KAA1260256.1 Arylsulfatase [Rubripirellula obstinata]